MRLAFSLLLWCAFASLPVVVAEENKAFPDSPILYAGVHQRAKIFPMTSSRTDVLISGLHARTSVTMTFHNPYKNMLPGEMIFPLPEGAVVRSYAIDVGGRLVESSVVEKDKARLSFDEELSQNIDPGFVEHLSGSLFRTYIWPMVPNITRTICIEYTQPLETSGYESVYRRPLRFKHASGPYRLNVRVVHAPDRATVRQGPEGLKLIDRGREQVASWNRISPGKLKDLEIVVPTGGRSVVHLEQMRPPPDRFGNPPSLKQPEETYFLISDMPRPPAGEADRPAPKRVGILWDASLSRARQDKAKQFELIRRWLGSIKNVQVDLVVFRNKLEKTRTFTVREGKVEPLIRAIQAVQYDGGTDLSLFNKTFQKKVGSGVDCWLMFSDGITNLGQTRFATFASPVYTMTCSNLANHRMLREIAYRSMGSYIPLGRLEVARAVKRLGRRPFRYLGCEYDRQAIAEVTTPVDPTVLDRFRLSGRLIADEAKITLHYGYGREPVFRVTHRIRRADTKDYGGMVRDAWARHKVDQWSVQPEVNRRSLIELGKRFRMVTPYTSLLVLENLSQHLRHGVPPHPDRKKMHAEYLSKISERQKQRKQQDRLRVDEVIAAWNERKAWWNTEFKYPENFKYKHEEIAAGFFGNGGRARFVRPKPRIEVKPWDPKTPYTDALKKAGPDGDYAEYLRQRKAYFGSPGFYFDCAEHFYRTDRPELAVRVLSSVLDLDLKRPVLIRMVAYRLAQAGQFLFNDGLIQLF